MFGTDMRTFDKRLGEDVYLIKKRPDFPTELPIDYNERRERKRQNNYRKKFSQKIKWK